MRKTGLVVNCAYCKKEIYRPLWQLQNSKNSFCSKNCEGNWLTTNKSGENSSLYGKVGRSGKDNPSWKSIKINCSYCNKELYRPPWRLRKSQYVFCDKDCLGKWNRLRLKGSNNPRWKNIEINCFWCLKKISRKPWEINSSGKNFCSKKCLNVWKASIVGDKHPNTGSKRTDETKEKIGYKSRERWKDPAFVKKILKIWKVRPNKPEMQIQNVLDNLFPNEYKYVGDGQLIVGGKLPDFANVNGKKKLIEHYGTYWHKTDNPQDRIDLFKKYGYDTLIVWQKELKDEETLKNRLIEFHNRKMEHAL